jgi:hypothetical protein
MSDYYLLITDAGKALEVAAHASGEPVSLTDFAVGDGGGSPVIPDATQTALTNETFRDVLSSLNVSINDASVLEAECIIPASSGGYTIREIGIFASDGTLYAVGNFAEQEKPAPDSGYAASLKILADLVVTDTRDITLTVQDGSYLTETQADTIYLRQDKRLSEIAEQGTDAQAETRDNIGCGTAAAADITENSRDTTEGRVIKSGDYGIGRWKGYISTGIDFKSFEFILGEYLFVQMSSCTNYPSVLNSTAYYFIHVHGIRDQDSSPGLKIINYADPAEEWIAYAWGAAGQEREWRIYREYNTGYKPTSADVGALPLAGGTMTGEISLPAIGNGSYASQNDLKAPLYQWIDSGQTSEFWPIIKQHYSQGNCTWSAGMTINADDFHIHYIAGNGDAVTFNFGKNGQFIPPNYANFDAKYQAKGSYYTTSQSDSRYIQAMRQGTQGGVTVQSDTDSLTPTGSYAMGWHAEGDNPGGDTLIYRYLQAKVNGSWATIGYNTASPNPTLKTKKLPRSRLSQLTNLQMYRPDEDWPEYLMNFIDESGYPWHLVASELEGSVFIAYDGEGVIQQIDTDVTMLTPLNLSVAGLDSVPDGCSINSSWKFDGTNIYQDADMASAAILNANTAKRNCLANKTTTAIAMFNASAAVGNPRDGDADNLINAQSYLDALRDVDLTLESPSWPTVPTFIH